MSTITSDRPTPVGAKSARGLELSAADSGVASLAAKLLIAVSCLAAIALIVVIAVDTSPIADDYVDLAQIGHSGVLQYLHSFWSTLTDRYSDALFMVVLIEPFGTMALHVATPLLLALLTCFCLIAARTLAGDISSRRTAALFAPVAAVAIAMAAPSIFDTLGWFNAVAIYLTGIVAASGVAAWMARLAARQTAPSRLQIAASLVIGVAAAGFIELVGMVITAAALLAIATVRAQLAPGTKQRGLTAAYLALATGSAGGVLVILYGPGSRARYRSQDGGFDPSRIAASLHANLVWLGTLRSDALAAAAAGLLLCAVRPLVMTSRTRRWLMIWCVFLFVVPMVLVDVSTALAGQTVVAPRTAYVSVVFVAAGVAALFYLIAAVAITERPRIQRQLLPGAAMLFCLSTASFATLALPVIRAERLRQTALQARAASIREQLAEHRHVVALTPAPLVIPDTSAFDLSFHNQSQFTYVLPAIRQYYEIPKKITVRIDPVQPRGYCMDGVSVPWTGVDSCERLSALAKADVNGRN